eukprot:4242843-Pyramimonas_sp.AAC.1
MPLMLSALANCPIAQAILLVTTDAGGDTIVVDDTMDDSQDAEDPQCRGRKESCDCKGFRRRRARPQPQAPPGDGPPLVGPGPSGNDLGP